MIHRPMSILIRGFKKAEQGQTGIFITHSRRDEFGYLYSRFNEMLKHLNTLIDENYVQRIRTGKRSLNIYNRRSRLIFSTTVYLA